MIRRAAALALAFILLAAAAASAQPAPTDRSFAVVASEWQKTFDAIEKATTNVTISRETRQRYDGLLAQVLDQAHAFQAEATQKSDDQRRLLEALGPAPATGQPPEPRDIARQRADLLATVDFYQSRQKQSELAAVRAAALQEHLASIVRKRFVEQLLERGPSPIEGTVFAAGIDDLADQLTTLLTAPFAEIALAPDPMVVYGVVAGMAVVAILLVMSRRALLRRLGALEATATPSFGRRLVSGLGRTVANGVLPAAVVVAPLLVLAATAPLADANSDVLVALGLSLAVVAGTVALCRAALAPPDPRWSLTPLAPRAAGRLAAGLGFLVLVAATELTLRWLAPDLDLSDEAEAVRSLAFSVAGTLGLIVVAQGSAWAVRHDTEAPATPEATLEKQSNGAGDSSVPRPLQWVAIGDGGRRLLVVVGLCAIVAAALGYANLATAIMQNLLLAGFAAGAVMLLRGIGRELIRRWRNSSRLRQSGSLLASITRSALKLCRWLLDPVLVGLAVYVLAPSWGIAREDLARWIGVAFGGFRVGGVTISLTDLILAGVVLVAILFVARAAKRALAEHVLPRTRLDLSIQDSIATGFGYIGVVIAFLLAIAVLGIDLSNIALVAGALSVGIGFGLQAIVNNFVSGLILLIERPVKVGDWVIVGDKQGFVRRIHVRSTELETFERSTIILPNSELLSTPVVNWTHKDKIGRVDVRVGVDYGVDVDKVREILLACARSNAEVVAWPQPVVFFIDFGDSALVFELRAFLRDVEKRLRVASELRFSIERAFREAEIAFPYPQHDIHLRDLDRLLLALRGAGEPQSPPAPANDGGATVLPRVGEPTPGTGVAPDGGLTQPRATAGREERNEPQRPS